MINISESSTGFFININTIVMTEGVHQLPQLWSNVPKQEQLQEGWMGFQEWDQASGELILIIGTCLMPRLWHAHGDIMTMTSRMAHLKDDFQVGCEANLEVGLWHVYVVTFKGWLPGWLRSAAEQGAASSCNCCRTWVQAGKSKVISTTILIKIWSDSKKTKVKRN